MNKKNIFLFLVLLVFVSQTNAQLFKIDTSRETNKLYLNTSQHDISLEEQEFLKMEKKAKRKKRQEKFRARMNYFSAGVSQSEFMLNNKVLEQGPVEPGDVNKFILDSTFQYWGITTFYGYGHFRFDNDALVGTNVWHSVYMKKVGINIYAHLPIFYFLSVYAGVGGELCKNYINAINSELEDAIFFNNNFFVNAGLRINIPLNMFIGASIVRKIGFIFKYDYKQTLFAGWENFGESELGFALCWYIFR